MHRIEKNIASKCYYIVQTYIYTLQEESNKIGK